MKEKHDHEFVENFKGECTICAQRNPLNGLMTHNQPTWEELFDEGFVWEEAAANMFAMFRVLNEYDEETYNKDLPDYLKLKLKGTRTLAKPEYFKAFIHHLLTARDTKIRERLQEVINLEISFLQDTYNFEDREIKERIKVEIYTKLSDALQALTEEKI